MTSLKKKETRSNSTSSATVNASKTERRSTENLARQHVQCNEVLQDVENELQQTRQENSFYEKQIGLIESTFKRRTTLEEQADQIRFYLSVLSENIQLQQEVLNDTTKYPINDKNGKKLRKEKILEIEKLVKTSTKHMDANLKTYRQTTDLLFTYDKKAYLRLLEGIKNFGDITATVRKNDGKATAMNEDTQHSVLLMADTNNWTLPDGSSFPPDLTSIVQSSTIALINTNTTAAMFIDDKEDHEGVLTRASESIPSRSNHHKEEHSSSLSGSMDALPIGSPLMVGDREKKSSSMSFDDTSYSHGKIAPSGSNTFTSSRLLNVWWQNK
ncbi:hypothetical protein RFI_24742, partial [Reticulomyxa filosa]